MIANRISLSEAHQTFEGVIVAIDEDKIDRLVCSFATGEDRFKVTSNKYMYGLTPEIGEHWKVIGKWERDDELGDVLQIIRAAPSLPSGPSIQVWLQYNILGMGSWYPKLLWRAFKSDLPSLLATRQYEKLLSITAKKRHFPFGALVDACIAWSNYEKDVVLAKELDNPILLSHALRASAFYSRNFSELLRNNPYRLTPFASLELVDDGLRKNGSWKENDPRRLLAGVDAIVSSHFRAGRRLISREVIEKELAILLGSSPLMAHQAVDLATREKKLCALGDTFVQGAGVRAMEQTFVSALTDRQWHQARSFCPNSCDELVVAISNNPAHAGLSLVFIPEHIEAAENLLNVDNPDLTSLQWVTSHASRLRAQHPKYATHILSPQEFINLSNSSSHTSRRRSLILCDVHRYSLSEWIEVLGAAPKDMHLFLCAPRISLMATESPWDDILSARRHEKLTKPIHLREHSSLFSPLENAISEGEFLPLRPYEINDNFACQSADVRLERCVDAVVGISWQLQERGISVQILCMESNLRAALNTKMQREMQRVRASKGRTIGSIRLFDGDPVVQTRLWADSMPLNTLAKVSEVYSQAEIIREHAGRITRVHANVSLGQNSFKLTVAQVESLKLAYAISTDCEGVPGTDTVIIAASNFSDVDPALLDFAMHLAASRIVFVGPGAARIRPRINAREFFTAQARTPFQAL